MDWITYNMYFSQQSSCIIVVCGNEEEMKAKCAHFCIFPSNYITLSIFKHHHFTFRFDGEPEDRLQ